MRVHIERSTFSPGDTITGSISGTLRRVPRSITLHLVIRETAVGTQNDRIVGTIQIPVPVGTLVLLTPFAIAVPASAVPGHKEKKGQTAWMLKLAVDVAGFDQSASTSISILDGRPQDNLLQHPALPEAERAIRAQDQRLERMISKRPPWLIGLSIGPVFAFLVLGFSSDWFGLTPTIFILITVLLVVPGTIVSAVFWIFRRRPPAGITLQVPTVMRRGTSIVASVTVNDSAPMVACFTAHAIVTERKARSDGQGSDQECLYVIGEQCFELRQGTNTLTIEAPQILPATYSSKTVSFAHQVRVRRAPRFGLPSRFEPHVSQMVAVLS